MQNEDLSAKDSFNSYMVRLEVRRSRNQNQNSKVSIPIWCDWKMVMEQKLWPLAEFQFLYGAIGSRLLADADEHKRCFNSYMVRLEVLRNAKGGG